MPALKNAKQEHLAQELAKGKPAQTPTIDVRDEKGRFLAGNSGNGGRRPGSRNKLAQDFIDTAYIAGFLQCQKLCLREPGSYHAPGSFSFKAWPAESKLRSPQASGAGAVRCS